MTPDPEPPPTAPIKVAVVDRESPPQSISLAPGYTGLWVLVRQGGRPCGLLKLNGGGPEVVADDLRRAWAQLSEMPPLGAPSVREPAPRVSVVVCTMMEREAELTLCLESLVALDYPDYEVILIDNRAQSGAIPVPDGVRVIPEPTPGLSNARNAGAEAADGDIVAFTDDDVVVDAGWLTALVARLQAHPEEAGVTGIVMPGELETDAQLAIETYYGSFGPRTFVPVSHRLRAAEGQNPFVPATVEARDDRGRLTRSFPLYAPGLMGAGANVAIRASVLRALGGFDPRLGPGTPAQSAEDLSVFAEILWRGHGLGFEPAAIVHHRHRRDTAGLEKQIEGYGVGLTALLLALVVRDPRHLGRMLATAPSVIRAALGVHLGRVRRGRRRSPESHSPSRDSRLARLELVGMLRGPAAYVRARRQIGGARGT